MFFNILAIIIVVISLLVLYSGLRMLIRKGWIIAWMRGMLGLCLLGVSIVLVLVALDLFSYEQLSREKSVGTISFSKTGERTYTAYVLLNGDTEERQFVLKGDQWQMDARVIRWTGLVQALGAKPGYRLDRLSGRYYSLEDERSAERTVYELSDGGYGVDFWRWVQEHGQYMPWVEAVYGSATYVPMADGALYEVTLTSSGLAARALNDTARSAISLWQ
jgi:hypothetical protein